MIICFAGAHRTGKTTLAKESAKHIGGEYISVDLGQVQRDAGYDSSNQDYTFGDRIKIQEILFAHFSKLLSICARYPKEILFLDRSPMDLVGYTLARVQGGNLTEEQHAWVMSFIQRCHALTSFFVDVLIGIQPGIPLVDDNDTSAKAASGFVEHINLIIMGALTTFGGNSKVYVMPRNKTSMDQRLDYVSYVGADYHTKVGQYK